MISWLLQNDQLEQLLNWADMPMELWMSLCIPHQMAVFELHCVDVARLERATKYWDARFKRESTHETA